jgi:uncharacterized protein YcbX
MSPGVVQSIYRYPVKGLSPQALRRVRLAAGETLPCDRLYVIENGPWASTRPRLLISPSNAFSC